MLLLSSYKFGRRGGGCLFPFSLCLGPFPLSIYLGGGVLLLLPLLWARANSGYANLMLQAESCIDIFLSWTFQSSWKYWKRSDSRLIFLFWWSSVGLRNHPYQSVIDCDYYYYTYYVVYFFLCYFLKLLFCCMSFFLLLLYVDSLVFVLFQDTL